MSTSFPSPSWQTQSPSAEERERRGGGGGEREEREEERGELNNRRVSRHN